MSHRDRTLYLLFAGSVFVYVLLRAVLVPMVHDECASLLWYAQPGEWLPYHAHWDANNHFLSSGIGALLFRTLGAEPWAMRVGSLLAFAVYAWALGGLGARISDKLVRWCFWSAALPCPFVLDFFSMFRGYAIELAGWAVALYALLKYAREPSWRDLLLMLAGLGMGGFALLALLPPWGLLIALAFLLLFHHRRSMTPASWAAHVFLITLAGILPMVVLGRVALHLQRIGALYHGGQEGFIDVTVRSLSLYVLGSDAPWVTGLVVVLFTGAVGLALLRFHKDRRPTAPYVICAAILCGDVLARTALSRLLGVNYPEDRAGIHLVPLALFTLTCAVDGAVVRQLSLRWSALILLALPVRALLTANLDHCLPWPEQCIPRRFVDRVLEHQARSDHATVLAGHHQSVLPWSMLLRLEGHRSPLMQSSDLHGMPLDLRLIDARSRTGSHEGYTTIDSAMGPGLWLQERDRPLDLTHKRVTESAAQMGTSEFMEIFLPADSILRQQDVYLDIAVPITGERLSPDVQLVIEVNDGAGNHLIYDATKPALLMRDWAGDTLRVARVLARAPAAGRAVIYLHNPRHEHLRIGAARLCTAIVR